MRRKVIPSCILYNFEAHNLGFVLAQVKVSQTISAMRKMSSKNWNKSMSVRYRKASLVNISAKLNLFICKLIPILWLLSMGYPTNIRFLVFIQIYVGALPKCLCVTSCFFNTSLIFQDIGIFFSAIDSPDSQLQHLLS